MDQAPQQTEHFDTPSLVDDERQPYQLAQVGLDEIRAIYGHVSPLLETVYERSNDELNEGALASEIANGNIQFWVVTDGERVAAVIGTSLDTVATGKKKATIRFCSGHHSEKWLHLLDEIEAWAAFEGCSSIRMIARKGWAKKLPEYRLTHVLMEKAI